MPSTPSDDGPFVLVVDDYRSAIRPLKLLIAQHGIPVLEASSAHEAIPILEEGKTVVIVVDYEMPVRDGISLLDEVADRWPRVERILFSGHFDADLVLEAHGARHRAVSKVATRLLVDLVVRLYREQVAGGWP